MNGAFMRLTLSDTASFALGTCTLLCVIVNAEAIPASVFERPDAPTLRRRAEASGDVRVTTGERLSETMVGARRSRVVFGAVVSWAVVASASTTAAAGRQPLVWRMEPDGLTSGRVGA